MVAQTIRLTATLSPAAAAAGATIKAVHCKFPTTRLGGGDGQGGGGDGGACGFEVTVGDMYAEEERDLLFELTLPALPAPPAPPAPAAPAPPAPAPQSAPTAVAEVEAAEAASGSVPPPPPPSAAAAAAAAAVVGPNGRPRRHLGCLPGGEPLIEFHLSYVDVLAGVMADAADTVRVRRTAGAGDGGGGGASFTSSPLPAPLGAAAAAGEGAPASSPPPQPQPQPSLQAAPATQSLTRGAEQHEAAVAESSVGGAPVGAPRPIRARAEVVAQVTARPRGRRPFYCF